MSTVGVVLAAAGEGTRLGCGRKAAVPLGGRAMVEWSLDVLSRLSNPPTGVVVLHPDDREVAERDWLAVARSRSEWSVVDGGTTRAESVRGGVEALGPCDFILVHDAARPLLALEDLERVVAAAESEGAAILARPVTDSLKRVEAGRIVESVSRAGLWQAETPQVFAAAGFREVVARWGQEDVTDEASWWQADGRPLVVVESRHPNLKVTRRVDLALAEQLIARKRVD